MKSAIPDHLTLMQSQSHHYSQPRHHDQHYHLMILDWKQSDLKCKRHIYDKN